MRHSRFISSTPLMVGLLAGLLFAIPVVPLNADGSHSRYDVSQEVTLSGTVSSVLHKPAPGMIWGSHEHGIEVSPLTRERAAKKGVTL